MTQYRIKNWESFQHYKNRNPPWIKLHFAILSSEDWVMLADASRLLAVVCMLVASRNEGLIDTSDKGKRYIRRLAYLDDEPDFKPLIQCGFLIDASNSLADASAMQADARPEERQRRDRGETEKEQKRKQACRIPDGFPGEDQIQWAKENKPNVDPEREQEVFRDYWLAVPGQKGCKLDWPATWRNWIRRAAENKGGDKSPEHDPPSRRMLN